MDAELRIDIQPLWTPEDGDGTERCKSCECEIFGRLWRLSLWLATQGRFVDTESALCSGCYDVLTAGEK